MIAYFPKIYPNETFYSWLCRIYYYSGYYAYRYFIEDILIAKDRKLDMDYFAKFNDDFFEYLKANYDMEDLILNHTMFKEEYRFEEPLKTKKILDDLKNNQKSYIHKSRARVVRKLKYCPKCVKEDREEYGETYWHTDWQLRGVNVCPKHKCYLCETDIKNNGNQSPKLYVAEEEIPEDTILMCFRGDEKELAFAEYLIQMFHSPMIFEGYFIGDRVRNKLKGTKYSNSAGKRINSNILLVDLKDFYKDCSFKNEGVNEAFKISKIVNDYNSNHLMICQLMYWLGISVEEIMCKWDGDKHSKIVSNKFYSNRKGTTKQNWKELDDKIVLEVEEYCKLVVSKSPPKKVSVFLVEKHFGYPMKRFDLLPKSKDVIKKYIETNEQFCARKLVWGWKELYPQYKEDMCWRRLRDILNLRVSQVDMAIPFIEDIEIKNAIISVMPSSSMFSEVYEKG